MICYLNRGIILEQAIVALIKKYLDDMKINKIYENNQIHAVLNNHFAKLYRDNGDKAADSFPAIVVSTFDDNKESDMLPLRPQTQGMKLKKVGYDRSDIENILNIYELEVRGSSPLPAKNYIFLSNCALKGRQNVGLNRPVFCRPFCFRGFEMLCYLNRGIILEQAIVALIKDYLDNLKVNKIYQNNQIHAVLNNHFAKLYRENGDKAADSFPAIVVSTFDDVKESDMLPLRPQTQGMKLKKVGYDRSDIENILNIYELVDGNKVKIPGICAVAADETVNEIKKKFELIEKENEKPENKKKDVMVYGYSLRTYRRDVISVDIWAENIQLKNELYEQIRLFVLGDLRNKLTEKYEFFDPKLDDDTVKGTRVLPFLVDFGLTLAGGNVQFEVAYAIEQNVIDTSWDDIHREITIGGTNHVGQR